MKGTSNRIDGTGGTYVSMLPGYGYAKYGHRVQCDDGIVRSVTLASIPDTFFSVAAKCRMNGRMVVGFVTHEDGVWAFTADAEQ